MTQARGAVTQARGTGTQARGAETQARHAKPHCTDDKRDAIFYAISFAVRVTSEAAGGPVHGARRLKNLGQ